MGPPRDLFPLIQQQQKHLSWFTLSYPVHCFGGSPYDKSGVRSRFRTHICEVAILEQFNKLTLHPLKNTLGSKTTVGATKLVLVFLLFQKGAPPFSPCVLVLCDHAPQPLITFSTKQSKALKSLIKSFQGICNGSKKAKLLDWSLHQTHFNSF